MENKQIKPIEEENKKIEEQPKKVINKKSGKIISKLPEWSIEPPIKINRSEQ